MDSEYRNLVIDKGLLSDTKYINYSINDNFEKIRNLLKTIKDYRDYSNPKLETWRDYMRDFFSVFEFSQVKVTDRLNILMKYGSTSSPLALVAILPVDLKIISLSENFEWEHYLFYASKHFNIRWGVLFNGLELKIIDLDAEKLTEKYLWANIDEIITGLNEENFFIIYKLLFLIRNGKQQINKTTIHHRKKKTGQKYKGRFPQRNYRIPILQILIEFGGYGEVKDILNRVYEVVEDQLSDVDLRQISGGQYSWQNTAQWERLVMKKEGLLKNDSPKGIWEISDTGKKYYQDHLMQINDG